MKVQWKFECQVIEGRRDIPFDSDKCTLLRPLQKAIETYIALRSYWMIPRAKGIVNESEGGEDFSSTLALRANIALCS